MTPPATTATLVATLLVVAGLACGAGASKDTCLQVGPPQDYPMRVADVFIATGHPDNSPTDLFMSIYGGQLAGLAPNDYPQLCSNAYPADRPNYRLVGWVDTFFYADGGQPPWQTYCTDLRDAGCAPQPGQPHGEVVVTLHESADNVIVIPLSQ